MATRAPIGTRTGRTRNAAHIALAASLAPSITGCVHHAPHPSGRGAEPEPAAYERAISPEARSFYLRGAAALARGDRAEVIRASEWVIRLDRDPIASVRAAQLLAEVDPPDLERAEALAADAVARDPSLSEAHRALGLIRVQQGDGAGALVELGRATPDDDVIGAAIRAELLRGADADAEVRFAAWRPTSPGAGLDRARLALVLGHADVARREALDLADDAVIGADAFALAVDAGGAACDLREVHAFAVAHAPRAAERRWRDPLLALAERSADPKLAERLLAIGGSEAAPSGAAANPIAVEADGLLARGRTTEVLALTDGHLDVPSVAWIRAGALAALGRVGEAIGLVRATAADPVDAAVRDATVRGLVGDEAGAREVLEAVLDAPCPVAAWVALARGGVDRCAAAVYAEKAAAVRVGDPTLRAAAEAPGCAEQGSR